MIKWIARTWRPRSPPHTSPARPSSHSCQCLSNVDGTLYNTSFAADMVMDGIHEYNRIDFFQRAFLPFPLHTWKVFFPPCPVLWYSGIFYGLRLILPVPVAWGCNIHVSIAGVHGLFRIPVAAVVSILVPVIIL